MNVHAASLLAEADRIGQPSQPIGEPLPDLVGQLRIRTLSTSLSRRMSSVGQRPPPSTASLPLANWLAASKVPPSLGARPASSRLLTNVAASTAAGELKVGLAQSASKVLAPLVSSHG